jgi:hypothetical protein
VGNFLEISGVFADAAEGRGEDSEIRAGSCSRQCFGRANRIDDPERQGRRSQEDDGSVCQSDGTLDGRPVHDRAVLAAQVAKRGRRSIDRDARVVSRHAGFIDKYRRLTRSTEHVLADGKDDFAVAGDEPTGRCPNGCRDASSRR